MITAIEIQTAKRAVRADMGWHWGGKHTRMWHGLPEGILGIGFGMKLTKGKLVEGDFVRIYVRKKHPKKYLSRKQFIQKEIEGYKTDVVEVRKIKHHAGPGGSISNSQCEKGTLACVIQDSNARYLLGSWHVLTNVSGQDGDPVFMPSKSDDAGAPIVGTLIATPTFHLNGGSNAFDASVAVISSGVQIDTALPSGSFGNCTTAVAGSSVVMQGAVSGQMQGTIDGISEDIVVDYTGTADGRAMLTGQISIVGVDGDFSTEGDSGALVCTPELSPIGLLVGGAMTDQAGGGRHSYASPIQPILDFYQVTIVS